MEKVKKDLVSPTESKLCIVKILRTCVHDGAGLRTTIFFRGCGLNCRWCQNPEALDFSPNPIIDANHSIEKVLDIVSRDKKFYAHTNGGVTFSGGEPFLQNADALENLAKQIKNLGIHIAAETTLNAPWSTIEKLLPYIDDFFVDFKAVGDTDLHKKLTGVGTELILENLQKLLATKAKIHFRMVMVPSLNDSDACIGKAVELLKSIGYDSIELLKYHNMYEEKADKFGLQIEKLNITPQSAEESLKRGLEAFRKAGIKAFNVDADTVRRKTVFPQRVLNIQNDQREAGRSLSIEVSKLKTKFYRKNGFSEPTPIHRSKRLKYVLENKTVTIYPGELLVGNFSDKRVGGQVWEEQYGVLDISFLYKVNHQTPVAFKIPFKDRLYFYTRIFPFWWKKSLLGKVNPKFKDLLKMLGRSSEMIAGFQNNMAAIAHFIPNYNVIMEKGTTGLIEEIKQIAIEKPENNKNFYNGAIMCLEALADWADRYSAELSKQAEAETNADRKAELVEMARICKKVPRYPAETLHEAIQSMVFLHIAICQEAYENAVSFGRIDQILYPYYKKDIEAGRTTYEKARELIMLFVLKMDEAILVNDGDSLLNVAKLFETLSTDQALTFGGCDRKGNDATNDITYMLIDACELQPLAINMCARINKNSPKKYLNRLAEIYINGCPMPEMFSDEEYFKAIPHRHITTLENVRDYPIVGCVEPVASNDHFGNTDSANMNVVLPMLQAIKGQTHELWNYTNKEYLQHVVTRVIEYSFGRFKKCPYCRAICKHHAKKIEKRHIKKGMYIYDPPQNMEMLIERMQASLNKLATEVLTDQQNIEWQLARYFTTPLASSLFKGCLERGLDAYEGGCDYNTSGIQAVGIVDVGDSLFAINELVFKQKKYTMLDMINAIDANFEGDEHQALYKDILALPKFGDDSSSEPARWVNVALEVYVNALNQVPYNGPRRASYTAGYYALNVNDRYGLKVQALPSGRKKGVPLANSITNHYGMEESDLLSSLNSMCQIDWEHYAPNGTTATLHIDSALFPGEEGIDNLGQIIFTFLTEGGMQFQPNVISRDLLIDAYNNPDKYKYLMVRVAGYCSYFNELSDDLKKVIINRTCYA